MSALCDAIIENDLERVKRLVAKGANARRPGRGGLPAIFVAAEGGHIPIMHWLLTKGGSRLWEPTRTGANVLSCAASNGHFRAMQWLLEKK
jgi:hypothetical protein